jgi:4-hydroxythreonine-4-phosphate dehydrogenase
MNDRPLIAITMGDPAGIGPEIAAKALVDRHVHDLCRPIVVGSSWAITSGVRVAGVNAPVKALASIAEATGEFGAIEVVSLDNLSPEDVTLGQVSAESGRAAVEYVEEAARMSMDGRVQAMVTCPINKEAVHLAGFHGDIGHQEILARLTGSTLTATMLMTKGLRVAHLSTHKPLRDACAYVRKDNVLAKLRLTHDSLVSWGIERPRIAAAALNPHGGDGGLLGREEIDEIAPAVEEARAEGMDAYGPFPGDSVFYRAIEGEFDSVLAMYHDQGHIAIKVHNFEDSVTVTMGIPFIRTSVDHGTAFDIAGSGIANPTSLVRAIETASQLATHSLVGIGR